MSFFVDLEVQLTFPLFSDEFSSQDEDDEVKRDQHLTNNGIQQSTRLEVIGRCRAMYDYSPKLYDELQLAPGTNNKQCFYSKGINE